MKVTNELSVLLEAKREIGRLGFWIIVVNGGRQVFLLPKDRKARKHYAHAVKIAESQEHDALVAIADCEVPDGSRTISGWRAECVRRSQNLNDPRERRLYAEWAKMLEGCK